MKRHRKTADTRVYTPSELASAPRSGSRLSVQTDRERQIAEFAVGHYGVRDYHNGYRYDRREDVVAHASPISPRPGPADAGGPLEPGKRYAPTTDAEHAFMPAYGIRFDDGAIRHDELSDALNFAKPLPQPQRDERD